MIAARGIHEQNIRPLRKALQDSFQYRSFTQHKQPGFIGLGHVPADNLKCSHPAVLY
jgi:hypothetical protein